MSEPYTLYGSECSYWTAKIRSYLRCKRIPYVERTNADRGYRERAKPAVGYDIVPILESPTGQIIQDTVDMIDHLEPIFPAPHAYPSGPALGVLARFLSVYGTFGLIRAGLHFRWTFWSENEPFVLVEFGRSIRPRGPRQEQLIYGAKIATRIRASLAPMGLTPETAARIGGACERLMLLLDEHFVEHPYLLGGHPTLADYSFMAPFYGHFARDPYPSALMKRIAPNLFRWTERMMAQASSPEFHDYPPALFAEDAIPRTLMKIAEHAFTDFTPELIQTLQSLSAWFGAHREIGPGDTVPAERGAGYIGQHVVDVYGVHLTGPIRANIQWEHQKTKSFYDDLPPAERAVADEFLKQIGGYILMQEPISRPLVRKRYRFISA